MLSSTIGTHVPGGYDQQTEEDQTFPESKRGGNETDKVRILLKAYGLNRAESLARATQQFQAVGVCSVTAAWFIAHGMNATMWAIAILLGCVFANWCWILQIIIWRLGREGAEIERRVNSLAGEKLLTHEIDFGGALNGSYRLDPRLTKET